MRKPLSPETKYKIRLFATYIAAIIFCIFWLTAEVDITRRVKQDRITSTSLLAAAERGISECLDGDAAGMREAGEKLLDFYSIAKRNSEARSVLITFRRGYPEFTAKQLADLGAVAGAMLQGRDGMAEYGEELIKAIGIISDDVDKKSKKVSQEAADILKKITDEWAKAAEY